jgi:antitoxin component of MazEF toxin-antitoxin module
MAIPGDKVALLGWKQGDELSVDCAGKRLVVTRVPKQVVEAGGNLATNAPAGGNDDGQH